MTIEEEAAGVIARYLYIVLKVERSERAAQGIIRALNALGFSLVKREDVPAADPFARKRRDEP